MQKVGEDAEEINGLLSLISDIEQHRCLEYSAKENGFFFLISEYKVEVKSDSQRSELTLTEFSSIIKDWNQFMQS